MADTLKKLGRRIRHFRTALDLSQEKVAERSGISTKYMSDLERGAANVSIQILERVAGQLGTTVIDLLDNEHEAERDLLVQELVDILGKASDEKIKVIYKVVKGIA